MGEKIMNCPPDRKGILHIQETVVEKIREG